MCVGVSASGCEFVYVCVHAKEKICALSRTHVCVCMCV